MWRKLDARAPCHEPAAEPPGTRLGIAQPVQAALALPRPHRYLYVNALLGTPPLPFQLIIDTGSTMTYVPCASCGSACGPNHASRAFDPDASRTAARVRCGDAACQCGSPACGCNAEGSCTYSRNYAEASSSSGERLLARACVRACVCVEAARHRHGRQGRQPKRHAALGCLHRPALLLRPCCPALAQAH